MTKLKSNKNGTTREAKCRRGSIETLLFSNGFFAACSSKSLVFKGTYLSNKEIPSIDISALSFHKSCKYMQGILCHFLRYVKRGGKARVWKNIKTCIILDNAFLDISERRMRIRKIEYTNKALHMLYDR